MEIARNLVLLFILFPPRIEMTPAAPADIARVSSLPGPHKIATMVDKWSKYAFA